MKYAIVKIEGENREVVYRTNSLDDAWNYVHSMTDGIYKIFDTDLNKKYK